MLWKRLPEWHSLYPQPRRRGGWRIGLLIGGSALALLLMLGLGVLLGSQIYTTQAAAASSGGTVSQSNTGFDPGGPISFQSSGQTVASNPGPGPAGRVCLAHSDIGKWQHHYGENCRRICGDDPHDLDYSVQQKWAVSRPSLGHGRQHHQGYGYP